MSEKCIVTSFSNEELIEIIKKAFKDELSTLLKQQKELKEQDEFLNRKEASRYLKISLRTLSNYQSLGTIPFYRLGRGIYFKKCEIVKLFENSRIGVFKQFGR